MLQKQPFERYFLEMMSCQDSINSLVDVNWRTRNFDFLLAAGIEAIEAIEHIGWKWWKHQSPDMDQAKMEVIDMMHFVLAQMIQEGLNVSDIYLAYTTSCENVKAEMTIAYLKRFSAEAMGGVLPVVALFNVINSMGMSIAEVYRLYIGKNVLNHFRQENGYKNGTYLKMWSHSGKLVEDNEVMASIITSMPVDEDFQKVLMGKLKSAYRKMNVTAISA